jgi:cytochrome c oxidase cbb3-type subunit III
MRLRLPMTVAALGLAAALAGCDSAPGASKADEYTPPDQVTDFHALYNANCQACHGANGQGGPAMDLGNPEYQALVDDATLKKWISNGMPGTEMPAFAQSAGGMLTDSQVDAIVAGMRSEWRKPDAFGGATPPPYAQPDDHGNPGGNAAHGQQVYQTRCASCHQSPARQQPTSPVYLSLVSDQVLRTIIVAGRPDIHQPDWEHDTANGSAGAPLAAQDVTDLVTYLHSLRNASAVSAAPTAPAQQ